MSMSKPNTYIDGRNLILMCRNDYFSELAESYVKDKWPGKVFVTKSESNKKPANFSKKVKNAIILSFRSYIILQEKELDECELAINFHPAPPRYPGVGGYNFAIYNEDCEYGVVAHHMTKKIDNGKIIKIQSFPIDDFQSIKTLKDKSNQVLLELFRETVDELIAAGNRKSLDTSWNSINVGWSGIAKTRAELNEFCTVTLETSHVEIQRKYRACYYPPSHSLILKSGEDTYAIFKQETDKRIQ